MKLFPFTSAFGLPRLPSLREPRQGPERRPVFGWGLRLG